MRDRIVAQYGEKILRKSAMNIRGGAGVFERTMAGRGIRTAVEIGTMYGVSAAEMAQYCERVITVDLRYGRVESTWGNWDRAAFWRSLAVNNVQFVAVADDDEKARLLAGIDFDFAFIDGGHDRASVERDFAMTRRCGQVLFHDADDNGPDRSNDVFEFISTLPPHEVEFMDIFALWRQGGGNG